MGPKEKKTAKRLFIISAVTLVLGAVSLSITNRCDISYSLEDALLYVSIVSFCTHWSSLLVGVIYTVGNLPSVQKKSAQNDARRRQEEQKVISVEYMQAVASQKSSVPWETRYALSPCPYCGHYKVRAAKWDDKRASVAFWGAASNKIGQHFKCDHCYRMW